MIADVRPRRTDHVGVRRPAAGRNRHAALVESLGGQRPRHFGEELVVEPAHQPAHLDPVARVGGKEPAIGELFAIRLVAVFRDAGGARNRRLALVDQDRRSAGRIDHQKVVAPLPGPLLDQAHRQELFAEREPHETRVRTKCVMEQRQHGALISNSACRFHAGTGFIPIDAVPRGMASPVQLSGFFVAIALMLREKQRLNDSSRRGGRTCPPRSPADRPAELAMSFDLFKAFILGVVEGLTEFLPVSSTGHLLLVQRFFGFDDADFAKTFAVLIQFGAILALLSIYFFRLWHLAIGMFNDPAARRFIIGILIAFLPAAVVGALAHDFIKSVLFNVWIVCFALIVGGAILLWVDRMDLNTRYHDATKFTLPMYFLSGVARVLSMLPGVSRAGATIVSAMLLGADRRSAAEFSFWLAMPTMAGAFAYDLYKSHAQMTSGNIIIVAFGFVV